MSRFTEIITLDEFRAICLDKLGVGTDSFDPYEFPETIVKDLAKVNFDFENWNIGDADPSYAKYPSDHQGYAGYPCGFKVLENGMPTLFPHAVELNELGFSEGCIAWFDPETEEFRILGQENPDKWHTTFRAAEVIPAPTYSQAFRFFRDIHNLEYQIKKECNGNYCVTIHKNTEEYLISIQGLHHACFEEIVDCYSYEEAETECLTTLIQIVKNEKQRKTT